MLRLIVAKGGTGGGGTWTHVLCGINRRICTKPLRKFSGERYDDWNEYVKKLFATFFPC